MTTNESCMEITLNIVEKWILYKNMEERSALSEEYGELARYLVDMSQSDWAIVEKWVFYKNSEPDSALHKEYEGSVKELVDLSEYGWKIEPEFLDRWEKVKEMEKTIGKKYDVVLTASFEELLQIIFVDWFLYYDDEFDTINRAKERLKEVCPHKKIVDDYVEVDIERGESIGYCDLCYKVIE
jgi:hypothetical protein